MYDAAYEPLFQEQVSELANFIQNEGALPAPLVNARRVFVRVNGVRPDGKQDPFLLVIDADRFPLYPYDVGFADPDAQPSAELDIKNPDWFPYDAEQYFKTQFAGPYRVFVCVQPGFSREYFFYHISEQWNPHEWSLLKVVQQIRAALQSRHYQLPKRERA